MVMAAKLDITAVNRMEGMEAEQARRDTPRMRR